jgi:hypothetical protein
MTTECVARTRGHFRFTCQTARVQARTFHADVIHRPPWLVRRGAPPSFPFSLTWVRGAERRKALRSSSGTFLRCRVPYDRHAHLPALHCGDFLHGLRTSWPGPEGLPLTLSGQHLRRRSSRPVQPLKAAPSRVRAVTVPPGPWLRATAAGATPGSANQASLADALT